MKNKPYVTTLVVVITLVFTQFFLRGIVFLFKISQKSHPHELSYVVFYLTWLIPIYYSLNIIVWMED